MRNSLTITCGECGIDVTDCEISGQKKYTKQGFSGSWDCLDNNLLFGKENVSGKMNSSNDYTVVAVRRVFNSQIDLAAVCELS